jgi:hypothetical protein
MKHFELKDKVKKNGFEGWYTRLTDPTKGVNIAVIFAKTTYYKDPHGFIQIYDGTLKVNHYFRFLLSDFKATEDGVYLKDNHLSLKTMTIKAGDYAIDVHFAKPVQNSYKSAMGFLEKLPLETFQEVVLMQAEFKGTLIFKGQTQTLIGKSYMEKTYGKKFPKTWFWLQANHFHDSALSISMSGGHVPTLFLRPFGFFVLLYTQDKTYRFATYNFSRFRSSVHDDHVEMRVKKGRLTLTVRVYDHHPVELVGPKDAGDMSLPVYECINANTKITLEKNKKVIFSDESRYAGFEWMMKGAV